MTLELFATAPKGVAGVVAGELRALGATQVGEHPAGVSFRGDLALAYRVCLWSRTASRILLTLHRFPAPTPETLYRGAGEIDWSAHLGETTTFAVSCALSRAEIQHSQYAALKVKDAIVDQCRTTLGQRPCVDPHHPDVRIHVHIRGRTATVSLDLSGESLHCRGYRGQAGPAPLKENLAAAILLRSGWPAIAAEGGALLDPMCGSGTLLIEAAMIAADIAPGMLRERFGFHGWRGHDAALWQALTDEARERREAGVKALPAIMGFDADSQAVAIAQANVEQAGLAGHVMIARRAVEALTAPPGGPGLLVVNPPYGERLGERQALAALFAGLGETLKQHFQDWHVAVFTAAPELTKQMGLRARRSHDFYNGALPCKLLRYRIAPNAYYSHDTQPRPAPATAEQLSPGATMFRNRLRRNLRTLGRWAKREDIACYRLYDADLPEYAVAVDVYQGERLWVHVQEYEAPKSVDAAKARARLREALAVIPMVLEIPVEQVFFKVRQRQKGSAQYEKLDQTGRFYEVTENGCRFWVNFTDYLDTGLFLDHRITRAMVGRLARGARFLNLFAYTGTATVYAALGGAKTTTTVDMSATYQAWARRNLDLNGIHGDRHRLVQADCLNWLAEQARQQYSPRFDLIFLDPPTFSRSKRMADSFDVQRDHVALIESACGLLAPGGVLLFSNNFRKFRLDVDRLRHYELEDISVATIPRDFVRNPKIHHCWKISRSSF